MVGNLNGRVSKLEAKHAEGRVITIDRYETESNEDAIQRAGISSGPDDLVVLITLFSDVELTPPKVLN